MNFQFSEERALGEVRKGFTHFAEGDVLFAKITPCMENGKGAVASELINGLGCGTTELHVLRPREGIDPKYIYHYLHRASFREEATRNFTGTAGQLRVPVDFIRNSEIPLPPANEQHRIVAKLEELLSRVDGVQARLATIPRILKRFRQSVLTAACSGRLTADWRDNNGSEELPQGWSLLEFGNLIADGPQNGLYKPQSCYGSGTPIVRIDAFYDGTITSWERLKRLQVNKTEREQFALANDDILINRVNSPKFLGKAALIQMMPEACVYESNMMRLRLDGSQALPKYAIFYLRSAQGLEVLR
jgi:type I restriction enzyme S subunit